ncbi:hypothetical protein [Endothiovibrio diazotrophicus]
MIPVLLSDWPALLTVRSDGLLHHLLDKPLTEEAPARRRLRERQLLLDSLAALGEGRRHRRNEVEAAFDTLFSSPHREVTHPALLRLFDDYYAIDGDRIFPRDDQREALMAWSRKVDPFCVVAAFLGRYYHRGTLSNTGLRAMVERSRAFGADLAAGEGGLADNHTHLAGIFQPSLFLVSLLARRRPGGRRWLAQLAEGLPTLADFPLVGSGHITVERMLASLGLVHHALANAISSRPTPTPALAAALDYHATLPLVRNLLRHPIQLPRPDQRAASLLAIFHGYAEAGQFDWSLLTYYTLHHHLLAEWAEHPAIVRLARIQLLLLNLLRAYMVMSEGRGLAHFTDFFRSPLRKPDLLNRRRHDRFRDLAINSFGSGVSHLEGRITANEASLPRFTGLVRYLDRAILDTLALRGGAPSPQYHFAIHFKRTPDRDEGPWLRRADGAPMPVRHRRLRLKLEQEARAIEALIVDPRAKRYHAARLTWPESRGAADARRLHAPPAPPVRIDLAARVTALDVAGDENSTPPEVFAPVIRRLRRPLRRKEEAPRHPRLRLTIHAGEDFAHLVTGMRRIDECLRYYAMGEGDRIGHGLAMGIEPERWLERAGPEITLPAGEHLDNCVWLWDATRTLAAAGIDGTAGRLPLLEREIARLSERLYGAMESPERLHRAWELRHRSPLPTAPRQRHRRCRRGPEERSVTDLLERYHRCPILRRNERQVERIDYRSPAGEGETTGWLDLWRAVQDLLIERCTQKGIVVEVCPTSNLHVAPLEGYHELPLYRWSPVAAADLAPGGRHNRYGLRNGPLACCIASDDPGLFTTTLANEFHLLQVAANRHCKDPERIEAWLRRLKARGHAVFQSTHTVNDPLGESLHVA